MGKLENSLLITKTFKIIGNLWKIRKLLYKIIEKSVK